MSIDLVIRPTVDADGPGIWSLLEPVFRAGETYAIDQDISENDALEYWGAEHAFVATQADTILGTYYIKRNQKGGGSHICNCGFVASPQARGMGVARAMLAHSLDNARALGFKAMQFNFVLANNKRAVEIWQRAGFDVIGEIPDAFEHPHDGFVNALIMYRSL